MRLVQAASSTDYNTGLRVGSGQCSQLSPNIRAAGTWQWSSHPVGPIETRQKTPTRIYAGYAIQNLGKLWQLWLKILRSTVTLTLHWLVQWPLLANFVTCNTWHVTEIHTPCPATDHWYPNSGNRNNLSWGQTLEATRVENMSWTMTRHATLTRVYVRGDSWHKNTVHTVSGMGPP